MERLEIVLRALLRDYRECKLQLKLGDESARERLRAIGVHITKLSKKLGVRVLITR